MDIQPVLKHELDPDYQSALDRLDHEQRLVQVHLKEVADIIASLRRLSLPAILSVNQGCAEIRAVDKSLRLRS